VASKGSERGDSARARADRFTENCAEHPSRIRSPLTGRCDANNRSIEYRGRKGPMLQKQSKASEEIKNLG
jgi:hypothetical protein